MISSIRSNVAAALVLLAPLGAGLVAQPVAAQHRVAPAQPRITAMALNSDAGLAPGATLRLQVHGTPGARSTIVTLGHGVRVALREQAAGRYVGRYVVSRADRIDPTQRMTVRARWGERVVAQGFSFPPAFQALAMGSSERQARGRVAPRDGQLARDRRAPRIFDVRPEHGDSLVDTGRAIRLSARLSDDRSGVDPASVRLRIDGQDVTAGARVHGDELRYRDDLLRGRHTAELTVRDHAGNLARRVWTFDVV